MSEEQQTTEQQASELEREERRLERLRLVVSPWPQVEHFISASRVGSVVDDGQSRTARACCSSRSQLLLQARGMSRRADLLVALLRLS